VEQGHESNLLKQLTPHVPSFVDQYDDRRHLLDLLYTSQRKFSGKTKAFNLLVAAHNGMNGWSKWHESSENSIKRLQIVADQYPKKIDDFIQKTTKQSTNWSDKFGNLIIPGDKLVFLLAHSGREKEAYQLTLAMVHCLEESTRNLQLPNPCWDWHQNASIENALAKILVSRLKIPVPTIKLLVIEQISKLLADRNTEIENLLIEDLANRKQESECVEVLCVFLVAKCNGYTPPQGLGRSINARSSLSDLLLSNLISNPNTTGTYIYPPKSTIHLEGKNHRFHYFQGHDVPRIYESKLKKEEQRTGIPLTDYYISEWNNTFQYQPPSATQIDYFLGNERQRSTGQFYTQASHRGRSAYLRVIDMAKLYYGMPDTYAFNLSVLALPIEPAYIGTSPQKPLWLINWKKGEFPNKENLIKFISEVLSAFERNDDSLELLALSFPILLDTEKCVDLTIVKAATRLDLNTDIDIKEQICCLSNGSLLEEKLSYKLYHDDNPQTLLLAVSSHPFSRFGHWHSDLESRGVYVPNRNTGNQDINGFSSNGFFCYSVEDVTIGYSSFWYNGWKPAHFKALSSLCGTYTAINKANYSDCFESISGDEKLIYICEAVVLSSKNSYNEHEVEKLKFTIEC
ncbi:hypothetical protein, partial [Piscirickettsia salmonis]